MYAFSFANMKLFIDGKVVEVAGDDLITIESDILNVEGKAVDRGGKVIFRLQSDSPVAGRLREIVSHKAMKLQILDDKANGVNLEDGIVSKAPTPPDHQGDWEMSFSRMSAAYHP